MSDMVERVSKAIYDAPTKFDGDTIGTHLSNSMMIEASTIGVDNTREVVMSVCRDAARAAIEAMREPTETMKVNGGIAIEQAAFEDGKPVFEAAGDAFRAMIDAALKSLGREP